MHARRSLRLGIDIGGTFTDLLLHEPSTAWMKVAKVLTTRPSPTAGVLKGIQALFGDDSLSAVEHIVHGTTLAANLVLEGKGAKTGLITTKGFRDILEMRRGNRVLYDLFFELPPPLVPRNLRREVSERVLSSGEVYLELFAPSVDKAWQGLKKQGVEALAIAFLHAYRNPSHEKTARQILVESDVQIPISLSSEVCPEIREYERVSTTVINAYIQPAMREYLIELTGLLKQRGFKGAFFMMLSDGGIAPKETAEVFPVRAIESGPAAGMLAAALSSKTTGPQQSIGFDMGGTTAKVCLIDKGHITIRPTFEIAHRYRLEHGTGYPVNIPSIDLTEIGQGGGSIAHIDQVGLLQVGPQSAGADPGPACYPSGGSLPTVTDADLILGLLDASYFLGGTIKLSLDQAQRVTQEHIAEPMSISVQEAALSIFDLVNENMAQAINLHCLQRGKDVTAHTLVAFGGAGPVHATQIAEKLGIKKVLVPPHAGVNSALGLLAAPLAITLTKYIGLPLGSGSGKSLATQAEEMETRAHQLLYPRGQQGSYKVAISGEMRYQGQTHSVEVNFDSSGFNESSDADLKTLFEREYERRFLRTNSQMPVEVVTLQVNVHADTHENKELLNHQPVLDSTDLVPPRGFRLVQLPRVGEVECPIMPRENVRAQIKLQGPAIIEERNTTVVVGPHWSVTKDEWQNLVLER